MMTFIYFHVKFQMADNDDLIRRCFAIAYARAFVEKMEDLADYFCPEDEGCNYIDEATLDYVYRPGKESNFRSWEAYRLLEFTVHLSLSRSIVRNNYYLETADYDLSDEEINSVYYKWGDPFILVLGVWKDDFIMCLHELLD